MAHHLRLGTMLREHCPECGRGPDLRLAMADEPDLPGLRDRLRTRAGVLHRGDVLQLCHRHPDHRGGDLARLVADPLAAALGRSCSSGSLFLPLVPWVFRLSRSMFIHFDRYFDPDDPLTPPSQGR